MISFSETDRLDFEACRKIHAEHGKSYYFATRFFPEPQRLATFALYAFFRIPDDIVDTAEATNPAAAKKALLDWQTQWHCAYTTGVADHPVLRATARVFHAFHIPYAYSESFLQAMIQDTEKRRYETYVELEEYMYGSAVVVGLMMTHIIGFQDPRALDHARELGEAMQLTNFLRDIREDLELRDRIYLPQEDLRHFSVTEQDLKEHRVTENMNALLQMEIIRCDKLYAKSNAGVPLLNRSGRAAVAIAGRLYQEILRKIEGQAYDVFYRRARTTTLEKVWLSFLTIFSV